MVEDEVCGWAAADVEHFEDGGGGGGFGGADFGELADDGACFLGHAHAGHEGFEGGHFACEGGASGDEDVELDGELDFFVVVEHAVEFGGHGDEVLGFAEGLAVEGAEFGVDGLWVVVAHEAETAFDFLLVGFAVEFAEAGVDPDEEWHELALERAAADFADDAAEAAVVGGFEHAFGRRGGGGMALCGFRGGREAHASEERGSAERERREESVPLGGASRKLPGRDAGRKKPEATV